MYRRPLIIGIIICCSALGALAASFADEATGRPTSTASRTAAVGAKAPAKPQIANPLAGVDLDAMQAEADRYVERLPDGRRVVFTVDAELQHFADDLFAEYQIPAGAAVVLNSRTGKVLALTQQRRAKDLAEMPEVALDPSPPAASLFKIITAAALIETGAAAKETMTCYAGGNRKLVLGHLADLPPGQGSCADLSAALGWSINAIIARLADRHLQRTTLAQYAERFGFNRALPFDVPLPTSSAEIPEDRLERARTAAGFWHTHLSPVHAATIMQSVAQNGAMLRPYIVERVESTSGAVLYQGKSQFLRQAVKKETARELMLAMTETVRHGTARKAFHDRHGAPYLGAIGVSGKTGTLTGANPYRAYTWFAGAAPVDAPEVSIAVLVVNEPAWRIKASGVAMQLLKKYFDQKAKITAR